MWFKVLLQVGWALCGRWTRGSTDQNLCWQLGGLPHFLTLYPLAERNETLHSLHQILPLVMRPYPHPTVSCIYRNLVLIILVLETALNFCKTSRADLQCSFNVRCVIHVNSPKKLPVRYCDLVVSLASVQLWLYLEIRLITG